MLADRRVGGPLVRSGWPLQGPAKIDLISAGAGKSGRGSVPPAQTRPAATSRRPEKSGSAGSRPGKLSGRPVFWLGGGCAGGALRGWARAREQPRRRSADRAAAPWNLRGCRPGGNLAGKREAHRPRVGYMVPQPCFARHQSTARSAIRWLTRSRSGSAAVRQAFAGRSSCCTGAQRSFGADGCGPKYTSR